MDAVALNFRQQRGAAIIRDKGKCIRQVINHLFMVPSQSNGGSYLVNVSDQSCSCPDFAERGPKHVCKHMWALAYFRREVELPDGTTVVQEVAVSYKRDWKGYSAALCNEPKHVRILLRDLCRGVPQPEYKGGRYRLPLRDVIYNLGIKVYEDWPARQCHSRQEDARDARFVTAVPSFTSALRYMADPTLLPILHTLLAQSAAPLRPLERRLVMAGDATCFSVKKYESWLKHREDNADKLAEISWVKAHVLMGARTNAVTAVEVTHGVRHTKDEVVNEGRVFPVLLDRTVGQGWQPSDICLDAGYLHYDVVEKIESIGAVPFVDLKSNTVPDHGPPSWKRMYHFNMSHPGEWDDRYHRRSKVEALFGSVKTTIRDTLRSRVFVAQRNEVMFKFIMSNLRMNVQAIYKFNIQPEFWLPQGEVL